MPEMEDQIRRKQGIPDHEAPVHSGRDCRWRDGGRGELQNPVAGRRAAQWWRAANHPERERKDAARGGDEAGDPGVDAALQAGADGNEAGLRPGGMRGCTVLIDDVPHYSCSVLTNTVRGKSVTTIEGLAAADGTLHPVQQAVVDEQGFQCAFCMSGFIMSAVGFLKTHPTPTRSELAHGISGNLCRCQDYNKILDSMMRGAEYMRTGFPAASAGRAGHAGKHAGQCDEG